MPPTPRNAAIAMLHSAAPGHTQCRASPRVRGKRAHRRDAIEHWKQAREAGLNARSAAAAVGVPLSTLYRRQKRARSGRLEPLFAPAPVAAVREARNDYPMRGKIESAALVRSLGFDAGESAVGRILKALVEKGHAFPVLALRRKPSAPHDANAPGPGGCPKAANPPSPEKSSGSTPSSTSSTAFRPRRALDNRTPAECLHALTADGTPTDRPTSYMS